MSAKYCLLVVLRQRLAVYLAAWLSPDRCSTLQHGDGVVCSCRPYHYIRTEKHPEHGLVMIVGGAKTTFLHTVTVLRVHSIAKPFTCTQECPTNVKPSCLAAYRLQCDLLKTSLKSEIVCWCRGGPQQRHQAAGVCRSLCHAGVLGAAALA